MASSLTPLRSRWAILAAAAVVVVASQSVGCSDDPGGLVLPTSAGAGGGSAGGGGAGNPGEEMFRAIEGEVLTACGTCHKIGGVADTPFLGDPDAGDDVYEAITSWPGVVVKKPESSVLINWPRVGQHTGGPTDPQLEEKLLAWLTEEAKAVAEVEEGNPIIPPFRPIVPGFNAVYLDPLGPDYAGMAVTFLAEELTASTLSLTSMQIHPTTQKGLRFEHPLFTVYPPGSTDGNPDPVDSFSNVVQEVEPGLSQELGPGTLVLTNWESGGKLSIAFALAQIIDPLGMGGAGSGPCMAVQAFIDNAQGPLSNNCTTCHGGSNPTATNAVDMRDVNDDPDAACGQILNRVNPADPPASQLFITTNPSGNASHPFKFGGNQTNFNNFANSVSVWIQAEGQ